jgi:hypothetical protein
MVIKVVLVLAEMLLVCVVCNLRRYAIQGLHLLSIMISNSRQGQFKSSYSSLNAQASGRYAQRAEQATKAKMRLACDF